MRKLDSSRPVVATSTTAFEFGDRKTFPIDPPADRESLSRRCRVTDHRSPSACAVFPSADGGVQRYSLTARPGGPQERGHRASRGQHGAVHRDGASYHPYVPTDTDDVQNLGLGVFEQHGKDFEMGSSSSSSSDSEDDEDSDSDTDSDSSSEIITSHSTCPRIIKPLPRRTPSGKAPQIVVLGSQDFASPES